MVTNGRIPVGQLSKVDPSHYAAPGCTSAFRAWSVKMVALGYPALTVGNVADSCYRSLAWQQYRYHLHQSDPSRYPVAAYPGTSNHGLGMAIDIGNYYRYPHSLLVKWGKVYGFRFDTPSELWHVRYVGTPQYKSLLPVNPPTLIRLDLDMRLVLDPSRNRADTARPNIYYVVGNGAPYEFPGTQAQANGFSKTWGATIIPSKTEWAAGFLTIYTPR